MVKNDLSSYKNLYIQTGKQYLKEIQENLSLLTKNNNNPHALETIYRSAHSLKGQSLVMGYTSVARACMIIEYIFKDIQDKKKTDLSRLLPLMETIMKALQDSLTSIEKENKEKDLTEEVNNLKHISGITLSK